MTPEEIKNKFEEMVSEIQELKNEVMSLRTASTIPFEVEQALKTRLKNAFSTGGIVVGSKSTSSESIPVNTAAGTNVQLFPDVFLETVIGGVTYYIAAYT